MALGGFGSRYGKAAELWWGRNAIQTITLTGPNQSRLKPQLNNRLRISGIHGPTKAPRS